MSDLENISELNNDLVAISRESIKRDLFNITFIIINRYICAWLVPPPWNVCTAMFFYCLVDWRLIFGLMGSLGWYVELLLKYWGLNFLGKPVCLGNFKLWVSDTLCHRRVWVHSSALLGSSHMIWQRYLMYTNHGFLISVTCSVACCLNLR